MYKIKKPNKILYYTAGYNNIIAVDKMYRRKSSKQCIHLPTRVADSYYRNCTMVYCSRILGGGGGESGVIILILHDNLLASYSSTTKWSTIENILFTRLSTTLHTVQELRRSRPISLHPNQPYIVLCIIYFMHVTYIKRGLNIIFKWYLFLMTSRLRVFFFRSTINENVGFVIFYNFKIGPTATTTIPQAQNNVLL